MKKKEKQLWLEAIDKIRNHYKGQLPKIFPKSYPAANLESCPLCDVSENADVKSSTASVCDYCLWKKFEGASCVAKLFNLDTTQERLDRLDRWEKLIKEIK